MATGRKPGKRIISTCIGALVLGLAIPVAIAATAEEHEKDNQKAIKMWEIGNFTEAMALWHKIAEQGYAPAQVWLANTLDYSEQNEAAVVWFRKAADQGDPAGEFGLAAMYEKGEGIAQDNGQALTYFTRAAEKNYQDAVFRLALLYKNGGLGLQPDPEKAAFWGAKAEAFIPKEDPKDEKKKKRKR